MVHMAMNTPIGAEAEQMQVPLAVGSFQPAPSALGVTELVAAHRVANRTILADDAARTDGQAHFRVAHLLTGRPTWEPLASIRVWIGMPEGIHTGVPLCWMALCSLRPVAPAIKNGENDRCNCPGALNRW